MKVIACPWCEGKGYKMQLVLDGPKTKPGQLLEYKGVDCVKCLGSGVIAFKPIKEVSDES